MSPPVRIYIVLWSCFTHIQIYLASNRDDKKHKKNNTKLKFKYLENGPTKNYDYFFKKCVIICKFN